VLAVAAGILIAVLAPGTVIFEGKPETIGPFTVLSLGFI
jgi:hypothetical protein